MQKILRVVLILNFLIWVSGCSTSTAIKKPDGALTLPMEKEVLAEDDTTRTLLEKFYFNLNQLEDGNLRFELIRE